LTPLPPNPFNLYLPVLTPPLAQQALLISSASPNLHTALVTDQEASAYSVDRLPATVSQGALVPMILVAPSLPTDSDSGFNMQALNPKLYQIQYGLMASGQGPIPTFTREAIIPTLKMVQELPAHEIVGETFFWEKAPKKYLMGYRALSKNDLAIRYYLAFAMQNGICEFSASPEAKQECEKPVDRQTGSHLSLKQLLGIPAPKSPGSDFNYFLLLYHFLLGREGAATLDSGAFYIPKHQLPEPDSNQIVSLFDKSLPVIPQIATQCSLLPIYQDPYMRSKIGDVKIGLGGCCPMLIRSSGTSGDPIQATSESKAAAFAQRMHIIQEALNDAYPLFLEFASKNQLKYPIQRIGELKGPSQGSLTVYETGWVQGLREQLEQGELQKDFDLSAGDKSKPTVNLPLYNGTSDGLFLTSVGQVAYFLNDVIERACYQMASKELHTQEISTLIHPVDYESRQEISLSKVNKQDFMSNLWRELKDGPLGPEVVSSGYRVVTEADPTQENAYQFFMHSDPQFQKGEKPAVEAFEKVPVYVRRYYEHLFLLGLNYPPSRQTTCSNDELSQSWRIQLVGNALTQSQFPVFVGMSPSQLFFDGDGPTQRQEKLMTYVKSRFTHVDRLNIQFLLPSGLPAYTADPVLECYEKVMLPTLDRPSLCVYGRTDHDTGKLQLTAMVVPYGLAESIYVSHVTPGKKYAFGLIETPHRVEFNENPSLSVLNGNVARLYDICRFLAEKKDAYRLGPRLDDKRFNGPPIKVEYKAQYSKWVKQATCLYSLLYALKGGSTAVSWVIPVKSSWLAFMQVIPGKPVSATTSIALTGGMFATSKTLIQDPLAGNILSSSMSYATTVNYFGQDPPVQKLKKAMEISFDGQNKEAVVQNVVGKNIDFTLEMGMQFLGARDLDQGIMGVLNSCF
jgi:hypothetical protein